MLVLIGVPDGRLSQTDQQNIPFKGLLLGFVNHTAEYTSLNFCWYAVLDVNVKNLKY